MILIYFFLQFFLNILLHLYSFAHSVLFLPALSSIYILSTDTNNQVSLCSNLHGFSFIILSMVWISQISLLSFVPSFNVLLNRTARASELPVNNIKRCPVVFTVKVELPFLYFIVLWLIPHSSFSAFPSNCLFRPCYCTKRAFHSIWSVRCRLAAGGGACICMYNISIYLIPVKT